jgi:hypothetical protein
MRDLDKALADILTIRDQIAAGTAFHGFGPATLAATGALALATATVQHFAIPNPAADPLIFFGGWAITAAISVAIIGAEMRLRTERHHSGLADAMLRQAVEQFLPAGAAGAALGVMFFKFAGDSLWMLPGLWQIFVSLGIFASVRSLPRSVAFAGAWYFVAGFATLIFTSESHAISPWAMGIPFAIGQLLLAAIIHHASGKPILGAFDVED